MQTTLTQIFIALESESHGLSESSRKARKFKRFFRRKTGGLQKIKKKVFTEIETDFPAKFGNSNVFSDQKQVASKKKRSSPILRLIFRPTSENLTLFLTESRHVLHNFGSQFPLGRAVFNFSPKIALKSTKNVRSCILHKPMEEARALPAPPPLVTLLHINHSSCKFWRKLVL